MGTQRIHISLYFTVITIDAIVFFGANRMKNVILSGYCEIARNCVQVCEAISDRCISLQRKVNVNMDSAKYQSDIIHDIEILCECAVLPQKGYIFIHDIAPCNNSKSTRTFQERKGIPVLE